MHIRCGRLQERRSEGFEGILITGEGPVPDVVECIGGVVRRRTTPPMLDTRSGLKDVW